jgi:hypothetical protein
VRRPLNPAEAGQSGPGDATLRNDQANMTPANAANGSTTARGHGRVLRSGPLHRYYPGVAGACRLVREQPHVSSPVVSVAGPELLLTYGTALGSWTSSADPTGLRNGLPGDTPDVRISRWCSGAPL